MKNNFFKVIILLIIHNSLSAQEYGSFKDSKDGKVYKTVKIGNQEWMAQNLNTDKFNNGQSIQKARNINEWKTAGQKKMPIWCYLNFDDKNATLYGRYYNWYAATDTNGIAPEGWHVPNSQEWLSLIDNEKEVDKIYRKSYQNFCGYLYDGENPPWFYDKQKIAYFWSTNTFNNESVEGAAFGESFIVWLKKGENGFNQLDFNYCQETHGLSIICVKDKNSFDKKTR